MNAQTRNSTAPGNLLITSPVSRERVASAVPMAVSFKMSEWTGRTYVEERSCLNHE